MKNKDFLITLLLLCGISAGSTALAADTAWISDNLTVPLRSGPSTGHRILHRGLPSGTELTILARDPDSDFVQIRTSRGTEGWLPSRYLVDEPIARDRLVAANRRIEQLTQTVNQLRAEVTGLSQEKNQASSSNSTLAAQVAELEAELAEIKRISAGAIEISEQNLELSELNDRLRAEVDDLVSSVSALEDNAQQRWLLLGGGLVLIGLIIGFAIKARPRRSAWS